MNDLISVIIPVKNGSNYLKEAIEGIKKQNMNIEIIVVDDGSTDNTVELAKSYGCEVIKHETNKGQVVAKNTGLKAARGEYVIFCDHDDILTLGALSRMVNELQKDATAYAVSAKVKDFISTDATNQNEKIKLEPYFGVLGGAILFRRNVFNLIGLFDENLTAGEVISICSRMKENNLTLMKIDFVSSNRRIHDTNYGKTNQKREYQDYASILRAKLARK